MSSTQKLILVGFLGGDPEARTLPSGDMVTNVSLAVSENWKDKSGDKQERTTWFRLSFWGQLAAVADNYLEKGSLIYVEGSVDARPWAGNDGSPRASLEVRVRELKMLSSKKEGGSQPTREPPKREVREPKQTQLVTPAGTDDDFPDDDIPF